MKKIQFVATVIVISSLLICANAVANEAPQERAERFRFGVGLGVPYGIFGINLSFQINDLLEVNAGLGTAGEGYLGGGISGRIYPFPKLKKVRPRVSAFYGVVGDVKDRNDKIIDVLEGPAVGPGLIWKFFRRHSIDLDFLYTHSEIVERINGNKLEKGNHILISLGYGYHF